MTLEYLPSIFSSYAAKFTTTHRHEVMARCLLLYDQMANNLAVGVAGLFQFRSSSGIEFELCFDVEAFGFLFNRVCQVAFAPRVDFANFTTQGPDERANPFDGLVALFCAGSAA